QKTTLEFPFTVEEVVRFGLFAHASLPKASKRPTTEQYLNPQPQPTTDHEQCCIDAMSSVEVSHLSKRLYPTLSGGESCRVEIARVLCQHAPLLLLDEPTNHLDPRYQMMLMELCQSLAQQGAIVIAALHDLNLAARFTDEIIMLHRGKRVSRGTPNQVLQTEHLREIYQVPFARQDFAGKPFVFPLPFQDD
ncbi:MAG: ATP-binding cassette domain-containing protein, partial [Myxococcota bacterium]